MPDIDLASLMPNDALCVSLGDGIWLMDDHRWAMSVWERYRLQSGIGRFALVHADYHWDGCFDFAECPELENRLPTMNPAEIESLVLEGKWIRYDSFIAPAIARGLVSEVHFLCVQEEGDDKGIPESVLATYRVRQIIHESVDSLVSASIERPFLFDLCLDLFNRSDIYAKGDLWSDDEIKEFLLAVRPLVAEAQVVTVSLSFNYSGTPDDTRHLASIVVPQLRAWRVI